MMAPVFLAGLVAGTIATGLVGWAIWLLARRRP